MTLFKKKVLYTTYFSITCVVTFFILSLCYRLLLPFGDEPDFTVRAPDLLNGTYPFWSPYSLMHLFYDSFNMQSHCRVEGSPLTLSAQIDLSSCKEPIEQIFGRWILLLIVTLPLIICCLMRFKNKHGHSYSKDALVLSITFPGVVYYLGVFSHEQFSLVLSLLLIITWQYKIITLVLCSLIMAIDLGNSVVVIFFVSLMFFYSYVSRVYSVKTSIYIMLAQVLLCLFLGHEILSFTSGISLLESKSVAMYELLDSSGLAEKYPVILRPIITFMSFVFYTPSFIKVPVVYAFSILGFAYLIRKLVLKMKVSNDVILEKHYLYMMVSLSSILSFVFMFPNYSNAKYYIFLLPFIFQFLLHAIDAKKLLLFCLILNKLVLLHLIFYSL